MSRCMTASGMRRSPMRKGDIGGEHAAACERFVTVPPSDRFRCGEQAISTINRTASARMVGTPKFS